MKPTKLQLEALAKDLRQLKNEDGLNLLRQQALKEQLLMRLTTAGKTAAPDKRYLWLERKPNLTYAFISAFLALMLSGGTVLAAQASLPGDTLYPVKRLTEKVEVALATSEKSKAEVEAAHAAERLTELSELKTKAAAETRTENKARLEQHEQEARLNTQNEVSAALNLLKDVQIKLETNNQTQAAGVLKAVIDNLTQQAAQSEFKVEIEKEHGQFYLKLPEPADDSSSINEPKPRGRDKEEKDHKSEQDDSKKSINVRPSESLTSFITDNDDGPKSSKEDEDENENENNDEAQAVEPAPPAPVPAPSPTPAPVPATSSYTMAEVKNHANLTSCWSAVNNNVYDLTAWISAHPGGAKAILSLCGTDGSAVFNAQHGGQARANQALASLRLGKLVK